MDISRCTTASKKIVSSILCMLMIVTVYLFTHSVYAQEFRATITGRVTDSTGAVVPNAKVKTQNVETGQSVEAVTDSSGAYAVPFLLPGKYSITVTSAGFRSYVHDGLTVQSGAKIQEDIVLSAGSVVEEVRVTADAEMLQLTTATTGQVLTPEEVANLPDNGRAPLALAKDAFGVVPKMKYSVVQARPFDTSAMSDFSVGGGASQTNEYLINGVPNFMQDSRKPGYSPLQDSVAEVRVDLFQIDASYGDTANGTINIITKAGTNQFHGTVSEFNEFSAINAPYRWFTSSSTKQWASRQNQYGGTFGGPVLIPRLHNKVFFFYAYEGFKDSTPTIGTTTVPTANEREGDFSALLALGSKYQLYNPETATSSGSKVVRTTIPNNCLTGASSNCASSNAGLTLNSVATAYLKYFPSPNLTGGSDGSQNYAYAYNTIDDYSSNSGRLDVNINDNNKVFFETHRSAYTQTTGNVFPNIATGSVTYNVHQGGVLDYIHTFSSAYTLDTRMGMTRTYINSGTASDGFSASDIGFPSYLNQTSGTHTLPLMSFSEGSSTSASTTFHTLGATSGGMSTFNIIQLFSALTALKGPHTLKVGIDFRTTKLNTVNTSGATSGSFTFSGSFMSSGTGASSPTYGSSMASFLLGMPTSGTYAIYAPTSFSNWYYSGFVQDDWRVIPNLTVNAGVRFESETSPVESNNRMLWFDPSLTSEINSAAAVAYAQNPISELPISSFSTPGGFQYAGTGADKRRIELATQAMYISPRLGFAYAPNWLSSKLAIHAGAGMYFAPFITNNTPQTYGYSSTTTYTATNNNYLTSATTLSDPFPTAANPIVQPVGSANGVNTYLGQGIAIRPGFAKGPYAERWNVDMQYAITPNLLLQVGYIGSAARHLTVNAQTSVVSSAPLLAFLSRSPAYDSTTETNLTSSATNPFKGLTGMTGSLSTASTITKAQLLHAYPQYSSVSEYLLQGQNIKFNELAARLQKRLTQGLVMNISYEYSKMLLTQPLNAGGPLSYQENTFDFPQHVSITASYDLPVGRGKRLLGNLTGPANSIMSGWKINGIYTYLIGASIAWGSTGGSGQPYFKNGTAWNSNLKIHPRNYSAAFDTSLFYTDSTLQPDSYNYRTFPLYFGRQDAANNIDASLLKDFSIWGERLKFQYRFETYNVLNHVQFGAPNVTATSSKFGTITSQANVPRVLQQGLRIVF